MKIALATDWFAPRLGGIESQLVELAEGLGARGHQTDVLTTTPGARSGTHFSVSSLDCALLPRIDLAISPGLLASLRRELARGYDVVHAHVSVVSPVGYAAAFVARTMELPTVVTFHSVLRAKRLLLSAADALGGIGRSGVTWTAVSGLVAAQARSGLRASVAVLPNGIHLAEWRAQGRDGAESPRPGRVTFVSTMRLFRKKRPVQMLRAFARAAARVDRPIRLIVVGIGPLSSVVHAMMDDMRRSNPGLLCELRARLTPRELRELYARSDGFVSASRRESFGIAALEACAAGLPVIAMREAGSSEFLRHGVNALLCDTDHDLSAAIVRLARDPELRAVLARSTPLERYDWSAVLDEHEATYRRTVLATRATRAEAPPPAAVASST